MFSTLTVIHFHVISFSLEPILFTSCYSTDPALFSISSDLQMTGSNGTPLALTLFCLLAAFVTFYLETQSCDFQDTPSQVLPHTSFATTSKAFFFLIGSISLFKIFIYLFVCLFMAVLGLRCCARAFSSCGK